MAPALYVHRKGANVIYGHYYYDYKDTLLLGHYSGKGRIDLDGLKRQYDSVAGAGLRKASVEHLMDEKRYFDLDRGGHAQESIDKYATTHVGDNTDTSPYQDSSGQEYISTGLYINNMRMLINYMNKGLLP